MSDNHLADFDVLVRKLEAACEKLWNEDRVSAIPLQAVANEVQIAFRHSQQVISTLQQNIKEQGDMIKREHELHYEAKVSNLEKQLESSRSQTSILEAELDKARARIEALMTEVANKEEENAQFKEKYLQIEVQKDSARAKHMEEFIAEAEAKEREREAFWNKHAYEYEKELKKRQDELEARHRELLEDVKKRTSETQKLYLQKEGKLAELQQTLQTDYESRRAQLRDHEEALRRQTETLVMRGKELEREFMGKRAELERLKREFQAEIQELTRHYRAGGK